MIKILVVEDEPGKNDLVEALVQVNEPAYLKTVWIRIGTDMR